jgi:hypothetical protein
LSRLLVVHVNMYLEAPIRVIIFPYRSVRYTPLAMSLYSSSTPRYNLRSSGSGAESDEVTEQKRGAPVTTTTSDEPTGDITATLSFSSTPEDKKLATKLVTEAANALRGLKITTLKTKDAYPTWSQTFAHGVKSLGLSFLLVSETRSEALRGLLQWLHDAREDRGLPACTFGDTFLGRRVDDLSSAALMILTAHVTPLVSERCATGWAEADIWSACEGLRKAMAETELDANKKLEKFRALELGDFQSVDLFFTKARAYLTAMKSFQLTTEHGAVKGLIKNLASYAAFHGAAVGYASRSEKLTLAGLQEVLQRVESNAGVTTKRGDKPQQRKAAAATSTATQAAESKAQRRTLYSLRERVENGLCDHFARYGTCRFGDRCRFVHVASSGARAGSSGWAPDSHARRGDARAQRAQAGSEGGAAPRSDAQN